MTPRKEYSFIEGNQDINISDYKEGLEVMVRETRGKRTEHIDITIPIKHFKEIRAIMDKAEKEAK